MKVRSPSLAETLMQTDGVVIHSIGEASEVVKDVGVASDMDRAHHIGLMRGTHGIGHVRMATESKVDITHSHPFWAYPFTDVTVVHNGQLTNYHKLKRHYQSMGHRFLTENDSELIAVYLADKLAEGDPTRIGSHSVFGRPGRHIHLSRLDQEWHGRCQGPLGGETAGHYADRRRGRRRIRGDRAAERLYRRGARPRGAPGERGPDVVRIDAKDLSTTEINRKIKDAADSADEITVLNPQARHNIAVGVLQPCKITIEGSVGYYGASLMDGPEVHIDGNAGWALGENLMSGKITVTKDAGASVAATMRGGEIIVGRNAGARAGISMKGGTLLIGGNAGFLTGFMMQKGRIVVCGDVGEAVGDSMYEGVIYIGGEIGSLGTDAIFETVPEGELIELWGLLERNGIEDKPRFRKIVSEKKLYHFDKLERLEMSAV